MTKTHNQLLTRIEEVTRQDARLLGLLVGGSYASNTLDAYSDLDCILVVDDINYQAILADREAIAETVGPLLHCFSGEFFGEPRLLICLYEEPLMHVDYKVMTLDMLTTRVEDPIIVWERDSRIRAVLGDNVAQWPQRSCAWFEEHFWVWLHYAATKVARGELFEALDMFALLRKRIFGPLLAERAGKRQYEVRHIERLGPEAIRVLTDLAPRPDRNSCIRTLNRAVDYFSDLCRNSSHHSHSPIAEETMRRFIQVLAVQANDSTFDTNTNAQTKSIFHQIIEIFNTGNLSIVDDIFSVGYIDHQKPPFINTDGPEEFKQIVALARNSLPNLQVTIKDLIVEGDKASARLHWHSIDTTGKGIERETIDILHIRDNKVVEHWGAETWSKNVGG